MNTTMLLLNEAGRWLVTQLGRMSVELAILAGIVLVALYVLRVKSPALRHLFWGLLLAKPVLTFLVASPLSLYAFLWPPTPEVFFTPPPTTVRAIQAPLPLPATPLPNLAPSAAVPRVEAPPLWRQLDRYGIAMLAWGLVASLLGLRLMLGCAYVAFLRSTARTQREGVLADLVAEAAATLRVRRRVAIATTTVCHGPVLAGIVRPVILLPETMATALTEAQLKLVITHELAHARRWDNLVLLIQRLAEMLFFFHPVVWCCGWMMRREAEAACDDMVVSAYGDADGAGAAAYADSLTRVAEMKCGITRRLLVNTFAAAESNFHRRIRRILSGRRTRMTLWLSLATGAALILIGVLGLPAASAPKGTGKPDSTKNDAADGKCRDIDISGAEPQLREMLEKTVSTDFDDLHLATALEQLNSKYGVNAAIDWRVIAPEKTRPGGWHDWYVRRQHDGGRLHNVHDTDLPLKSVLMGLAMLSIGNGTVEVGPNVVWITRKEMADSDAQRQRPSIEGASATLKEALQKRATFDFKDLHLDQILPALSRVTSARIEVDYKVVPPEKDAGRAFNEKEINTGGISYVSDGFLPYFHLTDVPAGEALEVILRSLNLTYRCEGDVIHITSNGGENPVRWWMNYEKEHPAPAGEHAPVSGKPDPALTAGLKGALGAKEQQIKSFVIEYTLSQKGVTEPSATWKSDKTCTMALADGIFRLTENGDYGTSGKITRVYSNHGGVTTTYHTDPAGGNGMGTLGVDWGNQIPPSSALIEPRFAIFGNMFGEPSARDFDTGTWEGTANADGTFILRHRYEDYRERDFIFDSAYRLTEIRHRVVPSDEQRREFAAVVARLGIENLFQTEWTLEMSRFAAIDGVEIPLQAVKKSYYFSMPPNPEGKPWTEATAFPERFNDKNSILGVVQEMTVLPEKSRINPKLDATDLQIVFPEGTEIQDRRPPSKGAESDPNSAPAPAPAGAGALSAQVAKDFAATLPDGRSIQLLSVREHRTENKSFWRPDGTPLAEAPYDPDKLAESVVGQGKAYEFAFRSKGIGFDEPIRYDFTGSTGWSMAGSSDSLASTIATVCLDAKATDENISVYLASGDWTTLITKDAQGESAGGEKEYSLIFGATYESKGEACITVTMEGSLIEKAVRLCAVDAQGKLHPSTANGSSAGKVRQTTHRFAGMTPQDIKEFQLQTCPWQEVRFENISLAPRKPADPAKDGVPPASDATQSTAAGRPASGPLIVAPLIGFLDDKVKTEWEGQGLSGDRAVLDKLQEQTVEIMQKRLDSTGMKDVQITKQANGRISVQIPPSIDATRAGLLLTQPGMSRFCPAASRDEVVQILQEAEKAPRFHGRVTGLFDTKSSSDFLTVLKDKHGAAEAVLGEINDAQPRLLPEGKTFFVGSKCFPDTLYLLDKNSPMANVKVQSASAVPDTDNPGKARINFTLSDEDARCFGDLTESLVGKGLAILVNWEVQSVPIVRSKITKSGQITGNYTMEEATDLAARLSVPEYPVQFIVLSDPTATPASPAPAKVEDVREALETRYYAGIDQGLLDRLLGKFLVPVFDPDTGEKLSLANYDKAKGELCIRNLPDNLAAFERMLPYFGTGKKQMSGEQSGGGASQSGIHEDFERHASGPNTWPDGWIADGNASNHNVCYVDGTTFKDTHGNTLRLQGDTPAWSPLAHFMTNVNVPFQIAFDVYLESKDPKCTCVVGVRKEPSWKAPGVILFDTIPPGNVKGLEPVAAGGEMSGGPSSDRLHMDLAKWYHVELTLQEEQGKQTLSVTLNDGAGVQGPVQLSTDTTLVKDMPYLQLEVRSGTAWYDNVSMVSLTPAQTPPEQAKTGPPVTPSAEVSVVTVTGTVKDATSGSPIADALVRGHIVVWRNQGPDRADRDPQAEVRTGADGRYALTFSTQLTTSGPMKGQDQISVDVSSPGYGTKPRYVKPSATPEKNTFENVDVALKPGRHIAGTAVTAAGTPFAGALVRVQDGRNGNWCDHGSLGTGVTDGQGRFDLWVSRVEDGDMGGNPWLLISKPGEGVGFFWGMLEREDLGTLTIPAGETIFGKVTNQDGTPVSGGEVSARYWAPGLIARAVTDAEGRYTLTGIPSMQTLDAFGTKKNGWKEAPEGWNQVEMYVRTTPEQPLQLSRKEKIGVSEGAGPIGRDIVLDAAVAVSGKIVPLTDSPPVADLLVRFGEGWESMVSVDATGAFFLPALSPGKHKLTAYLSYNLRGDRGVGSVDIEAEPGQNLAGVELRIMPLVRVNVQYVDEQGQPLEGITGAAAWTKSGDGFWTQGTRSGKDGQATLYLYPGDVQYVFGADMEKNTLIARDHIEVSPKAGEKLPDLRVVMAPKPASAETGDSKANPG